MNAHIQVKHLLPAWEVRKVAEVFRAGYASTVLISGLEGSPERLPTFLTVIGGLPDFALISLRVLPSLRRQL